MSNYTKSTNFATKDNLSSGDPLKIVKGTEIDTEFNNIATAVATKTDNASAAITGGTITGITDLAVADGGTGASNASDARTNLSAAKSGANSDITSLSGLTTALSVAQGGTGATSITSGALVKGAGTSAFAAASASDIVGQIGSTAVQNASNASTVTNGVYTTNFTGSNQSLTASGYQKLPGGLIMQWGVNNSATPSDTPTITFPIAFPTACVFAGVMSGYPNNDGYATGTYNISTTGFEYTYHYAAYPDTWFAIGY